MRELFPGYYRPSDDELAELWNKGIFVFDTNVLLNLYSYTEEARSGFLSVLEKIQDRIWIPYQVALEFHRRRFDRMKHANSSVETALKTVLETERKIRREVEAIEIGKRNLGITDIAERLDDVQKAHKRLLEAVERAHSQLPRTNLDDPIAARVCELFQGKVGEPPSDQAALDALVADAQTRYERQVPPGFLDKSKDDGDEPTFRDRGITYESKHGDLILWRQLLAHASAKNLTGVIFVTDDKKPDWWWDFGSKTIGPLPELLFEIKATSPVQTFWMYNAGVFLERAKSSFAASDVSQDAIDQVKDHSALSDSPALSGLPPSTANDGSGLGEEREFGVSEVRRPAHMLALKRWISRSRDSTVREAAVERWLSQTRHKGNPVLRTGGSPSLLVQADEGLLGYEISGPALLDPRTASAWVKVIRGRAEQDAAPQVADVRLVVVLPRDELSDDYYTSLAGFADLGQRIARENEVAVIVGTIEGGQFVELVEITP